MTVEQVFIEFRDVGDRVVLGRGFHARLLPRLVGSLDDPGAHFAVVLIGVQVPDSRVVLAEIERKGGQRFRGAEPDELVRPPVEARLEMVGIAVADPGIDAVRTEDQIGVRVDIFERLDLALKLHLDARVEAAFLEDQQQVLARHPAEAMPAGHNLLALVVGDDVVPVRECLPDAVVGIGIVIAEMPQRFGGKDDPEAERVVPLVLLVYPDAVGRIGLLHQKREVEACGAAADNLDLHIVLRTRSAVREISLSLK